VFLASCTQASQNDSTMFIQGIPNVLLLDSVWYAMFFWPESLTPEVLPVLFIFYISLVSSQTLWGFKDSLFDPKSTAGQTCRHLTLKSVSRRLLLVMKICKFSVRPVSVSCGGAHLPPLPPRAFKPVPLSMFVSVE